MFGQGEMVYNKNILVYKGRIIMYQKGIKRLLAVVLSACGLLVLSPLLLLLCLAIKLDSPGPIFFRQKRVGIHKSYFNILKFRTMRIDTPHDMPTPVSYTHLGCGKPQPKTKRSLCRRRHEKVQR